MLHRVLALILMGATALSLAAHLLPGRAHLKNPAPGGSVRFTQHLIQDGHGDAFGVTAANLDGDGR